MFRRAMAAPTSDSEVRVQKVDKLDLVFNILTKPTVYYGGGAGGRNGGGAGGRNGSSSNAPMAAGARQPAAGNHGAVAAGRKLAGGGAGSGNTHHATSSRGIVSIEDINKRSENYIRDRKRMFFGQN